MTQFSSPLIFTLFVLISSLVSLEKAIAQTLPLEMAQIIPDNSLGDESSTIRQDNLKNLPSDVIEGGATRGSNLFHSFQEFNINEGRGAYFANPAVINNIFSRVTGGNISQIMGTLGVLGHANLYLINPNGIIFGANARLDMRGAFVGSTADGLIFNNHYEFSASNPTAPPLLTVDIPLGVRFRENTGDITSSANLATPSDLTLQGGNVNLTGSVIAGGNLTLEAQNNLTIRDTIENPFFAVSGLDLLIQGNNIDIFTLNNPQSAIASYGNLTLKSPNSVIGDAHYYSGGNFRIEQSDGSLGDLYSPNDPVIRTAGNVEFAGYQGASLHIIAGGSVEIGTIVITGTDTSKNTINPVNTPELANVTLSDGTTVVIDGSQRATLDIRAGVDPSIITRGFLTGSIFLLDKFDFGQSGNFAINPVSFSPTVSDSAITVGDIVIFSNSGQILLTNQYQPNLSLEAGDITLTNDGFFGLGIYATGIGGSGSDVIFDARGGINVNSNINTSSDIGTGGNVQLFSTRNISLNGGESIVSDGIISGNINLRTNQDILVEGGQITSDIFSRSSNAENIISDGEGGNVEITARSLFLTDGAILSSSTFRQGNAGKIIVNVSDTISLEGENSRGIGSTIRNRVEFDGQGNTGGIEIQANNLNLFNGAFIDATLRGIGNTAGIMIEVNDAINFQGESSLGIGNSILGNVVGVGNTGDVNIKAGTLLLDKGQISNSIFGIGNADKIIIDVKGELTLQGESRFGTSAIFSRVNVGSEGDSSGVEVKAGTLNLFDGASINATTDGIGDAGKVTINVSDTITLRGRSSLGEVSGVGSAVGLGAEGNSGGIEIKARNLQMFDESTITASTQGIGDSGKITVNVDDRITLGESQEGRTSISSRVLLGAEGDSLGIDITAGTLELLGGGRLNTTTEGLGKAGKIIVNVSGDLILKGQSNEGDGSSIASAVTPDGKKDSEGIDINATNVILQDAAFISTSTGGNGNAGDIIITAKENFSASGARFFGDLVLGGVSAFTLSTGEAGNIIINSPVFNLSNNSEISAFTQGEGTAGNITINAPDSIILNSDTKLIVETSDAGTAGNININTLLLTIGENAQLSATATATSTAPTAGNINLNINQLNISGKLGIFAETNSTPTAGSLTIQPYQTNPNLNIQFTENGFISARTTNIGDGGSITLTAPENIDISGLGSITAETSGSGNAGNINIDTQTLTITDGTNITTSTESLGNAGIITLNATESLFLTNQAKISSEVRQGAQGNSQGIIINTPSLTLNNNARISAATQGLGNAGNVDIFNAETIIIDNNSLLNVQTDSRGIAGNINLTTDTLTIGKDSELSARSTLNATGTAGNITLNADFLNITGDLGIFAETNGIADAGNLNINPNEMLNLAITFFDEGKISASTSSAGEGGDINISAPQIVDIRGNGQITVETSGRGNAGNINITGQTINLGDGLEISASTTGDGNANNINLNANQISLSDTQINAFTNSTGNAGNIILSNQGNNAQSVTLSNNSLISTEIQPQGQAETPSNIQIRTNNLSVNNSQITASTSGKGNAGSITIPDATNITLSQSEITASTSGKGDTGEIDLNASNTLQLNQSNINSSVEEKGQGNSRQITLNTPNLTLNQSNISAATAGEGNAGSILIPSANNVTLDNSIISTAIAPTGKATQPSNITLNTQQLNLTNNSQITASTSGNGNAGSINITADTLEMTDNSIIQTNTNSSGNAGDINLIIQNSLILTQSAIEATTSANSTGNGGDIFIDPILVTLDDNARIAVNSQGTGDGGNIFLTAENLRLNNNSTISATTASGEGGNITLNITDTLRQRNNSPITATAGGTGNGGNITINAKYLIGSGNSDITANAFAGNGGNIQIFALGIFRDFRSEITASSELGIDGTVETNTPDVDPSRGLIDLPQNIIDPNALISQNACRQGNQSEFTVRGKGGLPNSPEQVQGSDEVSVSLIEPTEGINTEETVNQADFSEKQRKIIPAQGWRKNEQGDFVLIADSSKDGVNRSVNTTVTCSEKSSNNL